MVPSKAKLNFDILESRVMLACDTLGFSCVSGVKWHDLNRNGQREAGEPGLAGVTIFADSNLNREFDEGEPFAVTTEDDPATETDELGSYQLSGLPPGEHSIMENVPKGYLQTFPAVLGDIDGPNIYPGAHYIEAPSGQEVDNINFGNLLPVPGSMTGSIWLDENDNGIRDKGEPGLAGVTVFSDFDHDRILDMDEPFVITAEDNPATRANEAGNYEIELDSIRRHHIVQVVPYGFEQAFPTADRFVGESPPLRWNGDGHNVFVDQGMRLENRNFALRHPEVTTAVIEGVVWDDADGNGTLDKGESLLPGSMVYLDLNGNGRRDQIEPFDVTGKSAPSTGFYLVVKPGDYIVRQEVPTNFKQTFPGDAIRVEVAAGDVVNASFGNQLLGLATTEPDLRPGDSNGDGRVTFTDFLILSSKYGQQVDRAFADGDFDGNGIVDFLDYLILAIEFDQIEGD